VTPALDLDVRILGRDDNSLTFGETRSLYFLKLLL
jgi:hypothetical protein